MARPMKYTNEELIIMLREFRSTFSGKITPYLLEKHTGVSKAVWINRFSTEIEELNNMNRNSLPKDSNIKGIGIMSVSKLYLDYKENEKELLNQLISYDILVQNLLKDNSRLSGEIESCKMKETEIENLKNTILFLTEKLKTSEDKADFFENKYLSAVVQGTYSPNYRTENSNEPINMDKEENILQVDFISRNSSLFD